MKKIVLRSGRDYERLIRKIKYYKSFLFIKTEFIIEDRTNNKNVPIICEALNIKNRKKRIDYIYDQACKMIDDNTKGINICGFKKGQCYIQRKQKNNKCNGCCRMCLYQTSRGCSTKNLACKLFNCSEVKKRHEVIRFEDLDFLKILSIRQRIIVKSDYFSKREDVLRDLYSYSIIVSSFVLVIRIIRNFILAKKRKCSFD